jgi:hypothetical protein
MEALAAAAESDGFRVIRLHRKKEILKILLSGGKSWGLPFETYTVSRC